MIASITIRFALVMWLIAVSASLVSAQENSAASAPVADTLPVESTKAEPKLQKELDRLREKYQLPALWAGKFSCDGRSVVAASGVRKWKHSTVAQPEDVIHIGSCTKAMTAVMIAQLCSEGSLTFEKTLTEIFPDVEGLASSPWANVTVTDLLQHRSGAPENTDWQKLHEDHPNDTVAARRSMLMWLVSHKRPAKPMFVYSNVGYALLGHIVETIAHDPWEVLIVKKVFEPLDIQSAGFGPVGEVSVPQTSLDAEETVNKAWGHTVPSDVIGFLGNLLGNNKPPEYKPVQIDNPPPLGPAGRVHLSLADWAKFVLLFASDHGPPKLGVLPEIWAKLMTPMAGGEYAGGWILMSRDWANGRVFFHNGSNTTWYCVVFVAPEKGYCLLAATNTYSTAATKGCDRAVATADGIDFSSDSDTGAVVP